MIAHHQSSFLCWIDTGMAFIKLFVTAVLVTAASAGVIRDGASCDDYMFVADAEDLCRYHWCQGDGSVVEMRCAPGSRVPTWYFGSPDDHEIPCIVDHRYDVSCLRCDTEPDPAWEEDRDDCNPNPCRSDCRCEDNWQQAVCICPGDEVYVAVGGGVGGRTDFCDPDPCFNGAPCHSQWDDYWCQCPNGYTGKNCEVPFCDPNPCHNGGICTIDDVNYHCECTECFTGSCCDFQIGDGVDCEGGEVTTEKPPIVTPERPEDCDACHYGPTCDSFAHWRCDCQCPNYNDLCEDNEEFGDEVECKKDPYITAGTPFTFLFMENSNEDPQKRRLEVYVSNAGTTTVTVTVRTPRLDESDPCYFRETQEIKPLSVGSYVVTECLEHIGSSIEDKAIIAEERDGKDIVVYCANKEVWSADAYLAIPDDNGGYFFIVTSYEALFASEFAVVSLEDGNKVSFTLPSGVTADMEPGTYSMDQYQTIQVQAPKQDISGATITCTKRCHAWGGNIRALITEGEIEINSGSRDHIVEQLLPVSRWGYSHLVQPIPDRKFGDLVKITAVSATSIKVTQRNTETGDESTEEFFIGSETDNMFMTIEIYSNMRYIISSYEAPISVMQIVKSRDLDSELFHDPAMITIPAVGSHANNFILSTPLFSGGDAAPRPYQKTLLLVIADETTRDKIMISSNGHRAENINEMGAEWVKMPEHSQGVFYSCYIVIAVGTSRIYVPERAVRFQAIFYAFDDRETLGFPLSVRLERDNKVVPPVISTTTTTKAPAACDSCHFGVDCKDVYDTCECSPCASGQKCEESTGDKVCIGTEGPYGHQYTLTFLKQNDGGYKRVHITKAGAFLGGLHVVNIYTPGLEASDSCYVNEVIEMADDVEAFAFEVDPGCLETTSSTGYGQILRIVEEEGREIVVTVTNSNGDGYLALPDNVAGEYYIVHASQSSGEYQYVMIVAHKDDTVVRYRVPAVERVGEVSRDVEALPEFTLNAMESVLIRIYSQGSDEQLASSVFTSTKPINVWSGNEGDDQYTAEMLLSVSRWGASGQTHRYVIVQNDQDFVINTDDLIVVYSAVYCTYTLTDVAADGSITVVQSGSIGAGSSVTLPKMPSSSSAVWYLETSAPVQVTHSISGSGVHSAYTLIPSINQYASSFSWRTHGEIGGSGSNYDLQVVTIVVVEEDGHRDDLIFYYFDYATGSVSYYSVSDLGGVWRRVDSVDGDSIYACSVVLPGYGIYHLWNSQSSSYKFGAVYYGLSESRTESLVPNTAYPLGIDASYVNDIEKPLLCSACRSGPSCENLRINLCACNPCDNFDDMCEDSADADDERTCTSVPDSTGNPFTLLFMQNRPDDTEKRDMEVYVTSAGNTGRDVKVYTPYLESSDPCYYEDSRSIGAFTVEKFEVNHGDDNSCIEHKKSGVFDGMVVRVESASGRDLLVYAVNREEWSADGFVCLPDRHGGLDFYAVTYYPAEFATQLAFLALEDNTEVTLTYRAGVSPDLARTTFDLSAGQSVQIQSKDDLTGTRIQSTKPINAYSGNIRAMVLKNQDRDTPRIDSGSRDHIVEQLLPIKTWGRTFNIVPIPGRIFGDQLKFVAGYENTDVKIYKNEGSGDELVYENTLDASDFDEFDVFSGIAYRIESSDKLFVTQITKSKDRERESSNDPSLVTVPPTEQYTNRYIFSTPLFSGGEGQPRPYNTSVVLISARASDMDDIVITEPLTQTTTSVSDLGTWVKVPRVDYYNIAVEINSGTSIIYHPAAQTQFMCVYYGFDDRESIGMPAGLRLQEIGRTNN